MLSLSTIHAPAQAADRSTVSLAGGQAHVRPAMSSIPLAVADCGILTGSPDLSDFSLTTSPSGAVLTGTFIGNFVSLSVSGLADGQDLTISYTQNTDVSKQISCSTTPGDKVGSFTFTDTVQEEVTISGPSGNVDGYVGSALSMSPYSTTGLGSSVTYSYTSSADIPAGLTFSTSTGLFSGTPTESANNVMVTITATGSNSRSITVSYNLTITNGGGGIPGPQITVVNAPSYSITDNLATAYDGTWSESGNITRWWILCDSEILTPTVFPPMDCFPVALTEHGPAERGTTLALNSTVWMGFSGETQVNLADKFLGLFVSVNMGDGSYVTVTTPGQPRATVIEPTLTPEQARKALKPIPGWAKSIVPALPALNKPLASAGGQLTLNAADLAGLISASVGGKSLDLNLNANGMLTLTLPGGEAGKTADLYLNFTNGLVILQDAIKYVAPIEVAKLPERPVAVVAGKKKFSEAAADQIRQAAFANLSNTSIACTAYAAKNTAAAKAAAKATATAACALAIKANPALKNITVTVIVDAAKAKTSAVGIKVYR
jgi:hypothetical protein